MLLQPEGTCILSHAAKVACAGSLVPVFPCVRVPGRFSSLDNVKMRRAWGESPRRSVGGGARGFAGDTLFLSESGGGVGKGVGLCCLGGVEKRRSLGMPGGSVLEQSRVLRSTRKFLKLSCTHGSSALPGPSCSYKLRGFMQNCHFSEESDQALAQEDLVIWILHIFDQKERVIKIQSSAERSFPDQTSSRPPWFPSPTRQAPCSCSLGIWEGWADPHCW